MAKVATDFMKHYKWTSETLLSELAKYTEEINKSLKDDRKVRFNAKTRFRQLGLTKEQVEVLIPIRPTGKREEGRDTVDKIAQEIVNNDYSSEKINKFHMIWAVPHPIQLQGVLDLLYCEKSCRIVKPIILKNKRPKFLILLLNQTKFRHDSLYLTNLKVLIGLNTSS